MKLAIERDAGASQNGDEEEEEEDKRGSAVVRG
jgi:hypothetical protein